MTSRISQYLLRAGCAAGLAASLALVPSAEAAGPLSFYSVTPCRLVDTRRAGGPTGGPKLDANSSRSFPIRGACGIPGTAQAVVFNVTITEPTDLGDLRIYPAGTTRPLVSAINWLAADFAIANGAIAPMGSSGGDNITIWVDMPPNSTGKVHVILDVTGYFAP
jgi:hypothetical protein